MDQVSTKMKVCRILSFVITAVALLCVGVICLAASLKFVESQNNDQAITVMLSYVVLTLGAGHAAKELSRMLVWMLPG